MEIHLTEKERLVLGDLITAQTPSSQFIILSSIMKQLHLQRSNAGELYCKEIKLGDKYV